MGVSDPGVHMRLVPISSVPMKACVRQVGPQSVGTGGRVNLAIHISMMNPSRSEGPANKSNRAEQNKTTTAVRIPTTMWPHSGRAVSSHAWDLSGECADDVPTRIHDTAVLNVQFCPLPFGFLVIGSVAEDDGLGHHAALGIQD